MTGRVQAFTLVELMLVLAIIGLLMMMLIPEFTAISVAAKTAETKNRISMLHQAIIAYHQVFMSFPPSLSPDRENSRPDDERYYPPYHYADGKEADYLFGLLPDKANRYDPWHVPFGGKFLAYFLLGPWGEGWHRPKTNAITDRDYRTRFISAEWDFPTGLSAFLENRPVGIGFRGGQEVLFPCFADAFGEQYFCGGYIGYIAALPGKGADVERFDTNGYFNSTALSVVFTTDCRSHPDWPGDDKGSDHLKKILSQCPYGFALLSAGPNHRYGYRIYATEYNSEDGRRTFKGWWADLKRGIIDDIANYPLN